MNNITEIINNLQFASVGWQIVASLIFILSDVLSGVISAIIQKNLDSQKMREGLLRKVLLILIIMLSFIFQYAFNTMLISKTVCIYIIIMETISILENLKKAGIDLGKLGELLKIKPEEKTVNVVVKNEEEVTNEQNN